MDSQLTKRENEVILHLSKGKSNIEIANSMYVSINTIRTHLSSCYKKMKVKNRTELVIKHLKKNIGKN